MTTTLRLEVEVRDYDLWREAFRKDAGGRAEHGMRSYRIYRPVDDPHRVMIDGDFDDPKAAQGFVDVMRSQVWPDPSKAPSKIGRPRTSIVELVESHDY
jgi:hypothetical protein